MIVCKLIHFYKVDKTINDVPLKNLILQTEQTNWNEESVYMCLCVSTHVHAFTLFFIGKITFILNFSLDS